MLQFGGKDSKRHFTVVMGGKEHGLYVSSTPSSAARKAVTKLCTANKSKKVEFSIREITQGSKKKTYGPYSGYIEKLKEPIELKGRVIKYKPVAKLSGKKGAKKGGAPIKVDDFICKSIEDKSKYDKPFFGSLHKLFFGPKIGDKYFSIALSSDGSLDVLTAQLQILHSDSIENLTQQVLNYVLSNIIPENSEKYDPKIIELLNNLRSKKAQLIQQLQQQQQQQLNKIKNKIFLVSIDQNDPNGITIQYNGKNSFIMVNQIENKSSYLFFTENSGLPLPLGNFDQYFTNDYIKYRVIELLKSNRIVIKIKQPGSLQKLFGALVSNSNVINPNSILSNQSYKNSMIKVSSFLERKLAQARDNLN